MGRPGIKRYDLTEIEHTKAKINCRFLRALDDKVFCTALDDIYCMREDCKFFKPRREKKQ